MPTFLDIPNEILVQILFRLPLVDLLSTSLVCQRFRTNSVAPLYASPALVVGHDPGSLQHLTRVLLDISLLGTHVRSLQLYPSHPASATADLPATRIPFDDPLRRLGLDLTNFLPLLPHLKKIEIWPVDASFNLSSAYLQLTAAIHNDTLHLHAFREFHSPEHTALTTDFFLALLRLPCMRVLVVCIQDHGVENPTLVSAAFAVAGTSSVTDLGLLDIDLTTTTSTFAALLQVPRAIARLCFNSPPQHRPFSLRLFGQALAGISATPSLLNLHLSMQQDGLFDAHDGVGLLRGWRGLQCLGGPLVALLGRGQSGVRLADVLPRGLRMLDVTGDVYWEGGRVVQELLALFEASVMGALVEVRCQLPEEEDDAQRLEVACRKAGVKLAFTTMVIHGD